MAQKITPWLLTALVLSLGFGQLLRFDLFGIPLYFHDLLLAVLLTIHLPAVCTVIWTNIFVPLYKDWKFNVGKWWWQHDHSQATALSIFFIGLAMGWYVAVIQYPFSTLLIPALYTFRLLAYLSLYLLLQQQKLKIPAFIFLFSGFITLVIGYLQYFLLPDMRVFQYLGWDDHLNRLTLPHFDPTFTAVMLTFGALLFYEQHRGRLAQLFLPAIFLTYSRSIWLSLIVVGTMYAVETKKYAKLLLGLILLLVVIMVQPKRFGEGTNLLRTYSIASRFESDLFYVKKYNWDLLVGRGMNTLILDTSPAEVANHATGPNNSYLYLLLTSGVLGLAGWGMFMSSLYVKSSHKLMLLVFFIASLFNNVMFYPFALLWILLIESNI